MDAGRAMSDGPPMPMSPPLRGSGSGGADTLDLVSGNSGSGAEVAEHPLISAEPEGDSGETAALQVDLG